MNLKFQLQTIKKGNLSMRDYLEKVKTTCNTLAACRCPISEEGQVLCILVGLGPEFESTIAILTLRIVSYNVKSDNARFLASERRAF